MCNECSASRGIAGRGREWLTSVFVVAFLAEFNEILTSFWHLQRDGDRGGGGGGGRVVRGTTGKVRGQVPTMSQWSSRLMSPREVCSRT